MPDCFTTPALEGGPSCAIFFTCVDEIVGMPTLFACGEGLVAFANIMTLLAASAALVAADFIHGHRHFLT